MGLGGKTTIGVTILTGFAVERNIPSGRELWWPCSCGILLWGFTNPNSFCSELIKTFPCLYVPFLEGHRKPQSWSIRAAAVNWGTPGTELSHSTSLCWLLGESEGIPRVFQPPWLLLCQVHAGKIPRVQLSTSSSPAGDNHPILLQGFPSFLHKIPITTIAFSYCVCSVRRDKGSHYFYVLRDFIDECDISDCCNLMWKTRYWHLKFSDGCFTNVWKTKNSCRRQCC